LTHSCVFPMYVVAIFFWAHNWLPTCLIGLPRPSPAELVSSSPNVGRIPLDSYRPCRFGPSSFVMVFLRAFIRRPWRVPHPLGSTLAVSLDQSCASPSAVGSQRFSFFVSARQPPLFLLRPPPVRERLATKCSLLLIADFVFPLF